MIFLCFLAFFSATRLRAESGYDLWLRYAVPASQDRARELADDFAGIQVKGDSKTMAIIKAELNRARDRMIKNIQIDNPRGGTVMVGTVSNLPAIHQLDLKERLSQAGPEGYLIASITQDGRQTIVVAANTDVGALYGTYDLLRLAMTGQSLRGLDIEEQPAIHRRILDHWDNLDGTVERGYAGDSIWKWDELPATIDPRYEDYARANASIGINGIVLNNVNADPRILSSDYLTKIAALADFFRPYGIHIYLTANFASPLAPPKGEALNSGKIRPGGIGSLNTADPNDPAVRDWWRAKTAEIYRLVPDFGGFLVKADSEGMPGPENYGRSCADGANMLADILKPYGGIVMWRAFVYPKSADPDRAKREFIEFQPFDGKFHQNVMVQVKYGPLDFQPDEPFNPLFGAMPKTPLMLELEITQEYMGHANALVYLAPMWSKILTADTWSRGKGSTVDRIISGQLEGHDDSGIAGVANIGTDTNWCGSDFAQVNWYAYGRLAWNPSIQPKDIAREWIQQTWTDDPATTRVIDSILEGSWPAYVDYTTPLGLQFTMASSDHYSPDPQGRVGQLWHADKNGIGYDRTTKGSGFVNQYQAPVGRIWDSFAQCPDNDLLFFHYVPWDHRLKSGRTILQGFDFYYNRGTDAVGQSVKEWEALRGRIDPERFDRVEKLLGQQFQDACLWRDTYLRYFHEISQAQTAMKGTSSRSNKEISAR